MDEIFFFFHNDILEKIPGDVNKIDYSIFSANFSNKLPDNAYKESYHLKNLHNFLPGTFLLPGTIFSKAAIIEKTVKDIKS